MVKIYFIAVRIFTRVLDTLEREARRGIAKIRASAFELTSTPSHTSVRSVQSS